jgi:hypothetical protein
MRKLKGRKKKPRGRATPKGSTLSLVDVSGLNPATLLLTLLGRRPSSGSSIAWTNSAHALPGSAWAGAGAGPLGPFSPSGSPGAPVPSQPGSPTPSPGPANPVYQPPAAPLPNFPPGALP